uniref:hypothetical protein n=1 Tax=Anaerovirgula multivorans TaxID=312168 RepID=UPI0015958C37|nr:hypothetical protein [Anaerovirgula multivorans]
MSRRKNTSKNLTKKKKKTPVKSWFYTRLQNLLKKKSNALLMAAIYSFYKEHWIKEKGQSQTIGD